MRKNVDTYDFRGTLESGGLIAVDPVTDTALLGNIGDGVCSSSDLADVEVTVVPFVDWSTLTVMDDSDTVKSLVSNLVKQLSPTPNNLNAEEMETRRELVVKHLCAHALQPERDGDNLVIADTVIISPPYTHHSCDATNEIILARVKTILQNLEVTSG